MRLPFEDEDTYELEMMELKRASRERHLLETYGITLETFDAILAEQKGRCAICRTPRPGKKGWHVDHDHETGQVRGILCFGCNVSLGHFKDSPEVLANAIEYLTKSRA